ncbi:MAG: hypothetical protein VCD66_11675 [Alphaproteobacteria bacterium]
MTFVTGTSNLSADRGLPSAELDNLDDDRYDLTVERYDLYAGRDGLAAGWYKLALKNLLAGTVFNRPDMARKFRPK